MGWKYKDVVEKLEAKRCVRAKKYYANKKKAVVRFPLLCAVCVCVTALYSFALCL